jgi:hypothetical protein
MMAEGKICNLIIRSKHYTLPAMRYLNATPGLRTLPLSHPRHKMSKSRPLSPNQPEELA